MKKLLLITAFLVLPVLASATPRPESCVLEGGGWAKVLANNTRTLIAAELKARGIDLDLDTFKTNFRTELAPDYAINLYVSATMETMSGVKLRLDETDISYLGELRYAEKKPDGTPVRAKCTAVPEMAQRKMVVRNVEFGTIVAAIEPAEYDLYPINFLN